MSSLSLPLSSSPDHTLLSGFPLSLSLSLSQICFSFSSFSFFLNSFQNFHTDCPFISLCSFHLNSSRFWATISTHILVFSFFFFFFFFPFSFRIRWFWSSRALDSLRDVLSWLNTGAGSFLIAPDSNSELALSCFEFPRWFDFALRWIDRGSGALLECCVRPCRFEVRRWVFVYVFLSFIRFLAAVRTEQRGKRRNDEGILAWIVNLCFVFKIYWLSIQFMLN